MIQTTEDWGNSCFPTFHPWLSVLVSKCEHLNKQKLLANWQANSLLEPTLRPGGGGHAIHSIPSCLLTVAKPEPWQCSSLSMPKRLGGSFKEINEHLTTKSRQVNRFTKNKDKCSCCNITSPLQKELEAIKLGLPCMDSSKDKQKTDHPKQDLKDSLLWNKNSMMENLKC